MNSRHLVFSAAKKGAQASIGAASGVSPIACRRGAMSGARSAAAATA